MVDADAAAAVPLSENKKNFHSFRCLFSAAAASPHSFVRRFIKFS
jgi:hypothetical protein